MADLVIIWSHSNYGYHLPGAEGFTIDATKAARFDRVQALAICGETKDEIREIEGE